jgi:hypothetical protein
MAFQITPLPFERFEPLLQLGTEELAAQGIVEVVVDEPHAYPCRVTLEDAEPGERVLLFNYPHHAVDSPYAASGPIIVRRQATATGRPGLNEVPEQQRRRLLSVRAYDSRGWIVAAEVTPGTELEQAIERLFADPGVDYLHLHNARHGCYSARVDRAG